MNDKTPECTNGTMHRDMRFLIGGLFSAIGLGLMIGLPLLWKVAAMEASINGLNETMKTIVLRDVEDIKKRLTVQEQKQILPRAVEITADHEERIRNLELKVGAAP